MLRRRLVMGTACALMGMIGVQPAQAQTGGSPAPAAQAEQTDTAPKARISKKDCRRVMRHRARADVAYKPGVDVRGKKVTPADLSGGFQMVLPDVFEFNVTKDLSAYLDGPEEQLAAEKAAALAAEKTTDATDASVSSAALSLAGAESAATAAQTAADTAATAATAAQAASDADPTNRTLEVAAETAASDAAAAQATADTAASTLTTAQSAYNAVESAAATGDYSSALTQAQEVLSSAESLGYTQDATAQTASSTASSKAVDAASADAAALSAMDKVAKSADMSLNVGTVRFNINSGAMTFNGQPLNDTAMGEMAVLCQEMLSGRK
ncbi:MAG: hypothetical protein RIA64_16135 [Rhodospirillales bacterium]